MSKFQIPTIDQRDRDIANSAEIGKENRVFYSLDAYDYVGKLEQDGAAVAGTSNNNRYLGTSASSSLANSAAVLALGGMDLGTSATRSSSVTVSNQFVYYAYPKRYGVLTGILVDGLQSLSAFQSPATISVTPAGGIAEDYYVYRSTNALNGTISFNFAGPIASGAVAGGATLTREPAFAPPVNPLEGYDIQLVARSRIRSLGGNFGGVLNVTLAGATIASSTSASPGVITTSAPHGLTTGDKVTIGGVAGAGATVLNGADRTVTVVSPTTFTVGIATTGAGTGGHFFKHTTASFTFRAPSHVSDQGFNLPQGIALDLIADGGDADKAIRSVDGVASVLNGDAGNVVEIYTLPDRSTWVELGCVEDFNPQFGSPEGVRIPCRGQAARWTKLGRETDPQITLSSKYQGFAEGANRINGSRCVLINEVRKDDRILSERIVLLDVIPQVGVEKGDGNAVSMVRVTGPFSTALAFV
jgi:hypothetical protein